MQAALVIAMQTHKLVVLQYFLGQPECAISGLAGLHLVAKVGPNIVLFADSCAISK